MRALDPDAPAAHQGIFGLPHSPEEAGVVVIPVPFEAATSYGGGTAGGPGAVLHASRQVDLFDVETGRPYQSGIALLPEDPRVRAWNAEAQRLAAPIIAAGGAPSDDAGLARVNALCGELNGWLEATAREWMARDRLVGTLGGDHGSVYGAIAAHADRHPGLGILHLDAHADLRDAYEGFTWSHASIFHNVLTRLPGVCKLVQVGVRDLGEAEMAMIQRSDGRVAPRFDAELQARRFDGVPWNAQVKRIVEDLPGEVYLSFDIDGLDPTLCPHTGTPVPGGLSFPEAVALVAGVVKSGRRIVGFDLAEVVPGPDGSEWDGNVGARLLYKMIGWALVSRRA